MGLLDSLKKMLGLSGNDEGQETSAAAPVADSQETAETSAPENTPAEETKQGDTEGGM